VKGWELFTPAERRLAVLLFALAVLGQTARIGGRASPEVRRWLSGDISPPDTLLPPPPLAQSPPATIDTSAAKTPPAATDVSGSPPPAIDPNTADLTTLMRLPGVGPVLAQRILEDRAQAGPYARPEDLLRVHGIGPAKLAKLRPHLAFGGRRGG
jgi:predicted flap endonuclease-1-like 5' DNA nuclease